jgi:hypothetical protein
MNFFVRFVKKLNLTRPQRLLLFGSAAVWFLCAVLSVQQNSQDSWILEGAIWPFIGFVLIFLVIFWKEDDNRWVAIISALTVMVILLVPGLKYKQVYGQAIDGVFHYQMIHQLIALGSTPENLYESVAGMHSWLASIGITSGLSASDLIKYGFPLSGGIMPLLVYWICRRSQMPSDLTKYGIGFSCLATYPYHALTGTGFTLIPLLLFLSALLVREYFGASIREKISYSLLALIALLQLTVWHTTTPLLLLLILISVSFTPVLFWFVMERKTKARVNFRFLEMSLIACVLILGYHALDMDLIFSHTFTRLYSLIITENTPAAIIPASLFRLTLLEAGRVYLLMYGREAAAFALAGFGLLLILRDRYQLNRTILSAYAYWSMVILVFLAAIPLSLAGIDFRRLMWIPLAITPFYAGYVPRWWKQLWARKSDKTQKLANMLGILIILMVVGIFTLEFYTYQPLVPKSKSLTPDTPDEYVVWLHQVNTAYQQRMITFAEVFSSPETVFNIDVLGYRQYLRYYGTPPKRHIYLPLAPYMGITGGGDISQNKLFLLHWPGKAGGFGEQVQYRSVKYLTKLRATEGWGLIYDNGESFILHKPSSDR